jgi:small subunit ribosomal protein S17
MLTKQGTITSAAMQDTVTVTVHRSVMHPLYKKSFRKTKKFLVDARGIEDIRVGDEVRIQECRPLSRRKHFRILEVVKRAPRVSEMVEEQSVEEAVHPTKQPKEPMQSTSEQTHAAPSSVPSESSLPSPQ